MAVGGFEVLFPNLIMTEALVCVLVVLVERVEELRVNV